MVKLDPTLKRVIVGPKEALLTKGIRVKDLSWIGEDIPAGGLEVTAKIRSTRPGVPARITRDASDPLSAVVIFDGHEAGVSPGQAAVFYVGDRLLGGGWINGTISVDTRLAA